MTHQPRHDPETEQPHDRQAALQQLLESAFPPVFPRQADPEKTIQWLAAKIDKGMCRIYAVHINEGRDDEGHKRLLERVRQRIDDPQLLEALNEILTAPAPPEQATPQSLLPLLADIALDSIDQILQQAKALGREENFLHVRCLRAGNELIVLADQDSRYEWILPAVKKRLREELANLHYEPAAIETQALDLSLGHRMRFLDFELRLVRDRQGETKARYRLVAKSKRRQANKARSRLLGCFRLPRILQPCLSWIGRQRCWQLVRDAYRQVNSIQVGWRHLPITLFPVLLFFFGWRSLLPWLCLAALFLANGRWTLILLRSASGWTWRHKLDAIMAACIIAASICLYPFAHELYAYRSHEDAIAELPPGFFRGYYNKGSPGEDERMQYGLYVPPHFRHQKGPFPLLVFLHGFGERTEERLYCAGLPHVIGERFGSKERFDFVVFFPRDPTGQWQQGSSVLEDVMHALDAVVQRHHIDPTRIYLTGHSTGGSGVWNVAEAYPNKWAAVVPLCSFRSPDVSKVRHLPVWIFHGAKDEFAPVQRERDLARRLREAGADVRYTEYADSRHGIWQETYKTLELYDWLASKKKG